MSVISDYNKELYHYGVKGMKWGVRRAANRTAEVKAAKKQFNKDYDEMYKAAKKTGGIAITKKGKAKKAERQADYDRKFDKAMESSKNLAATRENAAKKIMNSKDYKAAQKKKAAKREKTKKVFNKAANTTIAMAAHYAKNKATMDAVGSAMNGDFGSMVYNASMANRYAGVERRAAERAQR